MSRPSGRHRPTGVQSSRSDLEQPKADPKDGAQDAMPAAVALRADKTVLQAAAAQVLLELVNAEARQRRIALAQVLVECVEVRLDQRILRRLLGAMPAKGLLVADARRLRPGVPLFCNDHGRQSGQATQAREADNGSRWCAP